MASLPVGINTYSYTFSHTARLAMAHLADMGYAAFEILVTPPHLWVLELSAGDVDFKAVATALVDLGYEADSMMEIVSPAPDSDIHDSHAKLARWGWAAQGN
jgi:hypothetical protein